jgi:hypothetical protein
MEQTKTTSNADIKALFIPLKGEYYDQFEAGTKPAEYRLYGKRWNEKTCYAGRPVVLSYGYGKKRRMTGTISAVQVKHFNELSSQRQEIILSVYGDKALSSKIISIDIRINR